MQRTPGVESASLINSLYILERKLLFVNTSVKIPTLAPFLQTRGGHLPADPRPRQAARHNFPMPGRVANAPLSLPYINAVRMAGFDFPSGNCSVVEQQRAAGAVRKMGRGGVAV